jgi:hypothetical protein
LRSYGEFGIRLEDCPYISDGGATFFTEPSDRQAIRGEEGVDDVGALPVSAGRRRPSGRDHAPATV